jgi:SPP1 gp7 family putative phage head morphogenesis protein
MPDGINEWAESFRAAVIRRDAAALGRLVRAYSDIASSLRDSIEFLAEEIGQMDAPTRAQVLRLQRYSSLLDDAARQLTDFQGFARIEMTQGARDLIAMGEDHARRLAAVQFGDIGVAVGFNRLPTDAIETLLGYLAPGSPLSRRLQVLAPATVERMSSMLLEGVALGFNPRKLARQISQALGLGLSDALRMTRTVQLYSYREASRASYIANSDVVEGWIWFAHLDGNVCPACVAMHGSFHTNDEGLNGHHNCRCTPVPVVVGRDIDVGDAEAWFKEQPEEVQQAIMGKGRLAAFNQGQFSLSDVVGTHQDEVYGEMRIAVPLKDLLPAS